MAATILDVAKLCGYSKATVSRAFASPEQVTDKTRQKVYEAAQLLNYTPDAIARAMVRGRTDNIGFIIYEKQYPVVMNPFYSAIFEAVLQTCARKGFSLFISSDRELYLPNGQIGFKKHMDGVLLAGQTDAETVMALKRQSMPIVMLNNALDIEDLLCVTTDQYGGAVLAMRHLTQRGHRKIGLIAGAFSPHVYMARYNGYVDVLREIGEEVDMRFVQTIEPTVDDAVHRVSQMLSLEDHPTALFCTNDTIAIGAIKAVLRAGLRIPEDVAIIGFDDSEISQLIEPELTTIHVDKEKMGRIAAEELIAQIEGKKTSKHIIQTSVSLVKRQTT